MDQELSMGKKVTSAVVSAALVVGLNPIVGLVPSERAYAQEVIAAQTQADETDTTSDTADETAAAAIDYADTSIVKVATLSDRSAANNEDGKTPIYEADSADYTVVTTKVDGDETTYHVVVHAKELPWHLNAADAPVKSYWTGIALPYDATAKYKVTPESSAEAIEAEDAYEYGDTGVKYVSFYYGSTGGNVGVTDEAVGAENIAKANAGFKKGARTLSVYESDGETLKATYNISFDVTVAGTAAAEGAAKTAAAETYSSPRAATLSDRGAEGNKKGETPLYAADSEDYKATTVSSAAGVYDVTLHVKELPWHKNDNGNESSYNYWTGIAIPWVDGVKYAYSADATDEDKFTIAETDAYLIDGVDGKFVSFYYGAKGLGVEAEAKTDEEIEAANAKFNAGKRQLFVFDANDVAIATYNIGYDVTVKGTEAMNAPIKEVEDLIDAIGTVSLLDDECKGRIDAAREAYDALGEKDAKKQAAVKNVETLKQAEKDYEAAVAAALAQQQAGSGSSSSGSTTTDPTTPTTKPTTEPTTDPTTPATDPGSTTEPSTTTEPGSTTDPGSTTPGTTTPGTTTPGTTTPGTETPGATTEQPKTGDTVSDVAAGAGVTETVKVTGGSTVTASKVSVKDGGSATIDTVTVGQTTYKVTEIAAGALKGTAAKAITVGNNVVKIGKQAFMNAKKLTKLTIGKNVKAVGKNVLKGASKLKTVTVKSSKLTKAAVKNLVKGSKVKTVKLSGVSKKAAKQYKKALKTLGVKVK